MELFYRRYVMVLTAILTQNFVITLADNMTHERRTPAEVLTSFLKVPWINLDSSWTDAEGSTCRNDIATVFESADVGEMWALQMLDAASKVPAGILIGNILELGMFDECVNVKSDSNSANIQGQHCIISLSMPTKFFNDVSKMMFLQKLNGYNPSADMDLSLSVSVCVPSSCGSQDINGLVNASIKNIPEFTLFEVGIAQVACSSSESSVELTLGSILTLSFLAMVVIFLLFCTACDFVVRARSSDRLMALKKAAKFSLYTNALKLTNTKSNDDDLPSIHGIRFLSSCLIVFGHRAFITLIKPTINLIDVYKLAQSSMLFSLIYTLFFVTDTFFLMSGFLTAYAFLKKMRAAVKLNVLEIYVHRYIRLTPCLAVVILFVNYILPYFISGPIWKELYEYMIVPCQKNWWINLLYVQNVVNADQMCLLHSWFLAAEMQLFWLSPIILYPLHYRPKLGLGILGLFLTASFFVPTIQIVVNQWSAIFSVHKRAREVFAEFIGFFPVTYNRALPYFIGIFLGYEISKGKRHISKPQITVNWILASVLLISSGWISYQMQPRELDYDALWQAIYVSVGRLAWSLAIAWVIYACSQGYGGPATTFLSLPVFVPLSRLSYGIYLVHLVLQVATIATQRTADYMTPFSMIHLMWGDLLLSIVIAFVISLCFESPITTLEKILKFRQSSASTEHNLVTRPAELSTAMEEYLNITTSPLVSSDLMVDTITSRLDFWQKISDALNIMSERPSKTPAEWSKLWKDWRSKLLKIERKYDSQSKTIQKSRSQLQTGRAALEKELLVFLAAMDGGFADSTSFEYPVLTSAKSTYKLSNQHCEVPFRISILNSE